MKKNIENSGAPSRMPTTLAPVSVLKRKIRNGTRGGCERSSIATNAPISATDSASRATILVELRSTALIGAFVAIELRSQAPLVPSASRPLPGDRGPAL